MWVTSEKDDLKCWVTGIAAGSRDGQEAGKAMWLCSPWLWSMMAAKKEETKQTRDIWEAESLWGTLMYAV